MKPLKLIPTVIAMLMLPRSKNKERIIENLNAVNVELTDEEFRALDSVLNKHEVCRHRGSGGS